MTQAVVVHKGIKVHGSFNLETNNIGLPPPEESRIGGFVIKDNNLYCYLELNGLRTWYPLVRNLNKSFIHVQGTSSTIWTINHNLSTDDIWWQAKDADGVPVNVESFERISNDVFKLCFSEPITGTVIVVGANAIDVPSIKSQLIQVGANVQIDTTGLKINGVYVTNSNGSTSLDFATKDLHVAGNAIIDGTATIIGGAIIQGNTTRVDTTTVSTKDNIIVLNEGQVGNGVTAVFSGVQIDRGDLPDYQFVFDETDDMFKVGQVGNLETLASQNYVSTAIAAADANSGVIAGTYGSTSVVPVITVNAKGKITNVTSASIPAVSWASLTGKPTTVAGAGLSIAVSDIPNLDASKITTGTLASGILPTATTSNIGGVKVDGTSITINNGVISAPSAVSGGNIYAGTYGVSSANDSVVRFLSLDAFTIPQNFSGSLVSAKTASTGTAVFSVQKNGVQVATITFNAGNVTGVFSTQSAISYVVGDKFEIVAPSTADATLADVDISIKATIN